MPYPSIRGLSFALGLGGCLVAAVAACGNSDADNADTGSPNDPFNTGNGGNDPYGYGSTGVSQCPEELKACDTVVSYPNHGESQVEIRGDFGGTATWSTGVPMTSDGATWKATIPAPYGKAVQYKIFADGIWRADDTKPIDATTGNNTLAAQTCAKPTCAEEGALPAGVYDWRDAVIYFVFVDRFVNGDPSNDFTVPGVEHAANYHGGDWAGVTQKIQEGYFTELGVNTLWITVPFDNTPLSGKGTGGDSHYYSGFHGYWPKLESDDPTKLTTENAFGTLDDLRTLVSTAHEHGLKVLFDFAMVHAHNSSSLFSRHPDWFWPNQNPSGTGDCVCGQGCSWDNDPKRCWFADYLPHWNYNVAAARQWNVANAVAWITQTRDAAGNGVDGFRCDAIKHIETSWLNDLRAKIATDVTPSQSPAQRFYMVGETFDFGNRDLIKSYVDPATMLDGQFDFPLRAKLVSTTLLRQGAMKDLAGFMDSNDYYYGTNAVMSTFIGNHDLPRIIHLAADNPVWTDQGADGRDRNWQNQPGDVAERSAYERVATAFAILLTNRGAPLIYYGDEIGLSGAGDPDNRRDMQWEDLRDNQVFLRDRIKTLTDIRAKHPALRRGTRTTMALDTDTWVYKRSTSTDVVYVAVNRSNDTKQLGGLPGGKLDELVTGATVDGGTVTVPPRETRIFVAK